MNEFELSELINDCPTLYHMAECGAWDSIKEYGLLSATAALDLHRIESPKRDEVEKMHRRKEIELPCSNGIPKIIIRDQIPMDDAGLERCLPAHLSPQEWYQILNKKCFFWFTESRLHKLTEAKAYRAKEHDVLELDTAALIEAYRDRIWLCPINSGCTKPYPRQRDENTFSRMIDYPYAEWCRKRKRGERAVELAVDYAVPDIRNYMKRVIRKRGKETLDILEIGPRFNQ